MKVRFFIRKDNVERTEIMLVIRQGTAGLNLRELRIHTGLLVNPEQWNRVTKNNNRRDRQELYTTDAVTTNRTLDRIEAAVNDLIEAARVHDREALAYIKEHIYATNTLRSKFSTSQKGLEAARKAAEKSVVSYMDKFVLLRSNSSEYTNGTIKVYKVVFKHLKTYFGKQARSFKFDDITKSWFAGWKTYLFQTAGLTNNTVEKHIKVFRVFLSWCDSEGYCEYSKFKGILVTKGLLRDADTISLSQDEVISIENLDLSANARLDKARDLFLLSVYTGLRYSDIKTLRPEHYRDGKLEKTVVKTSRVLSIRVKPRCAAILAKYPNGLPSISGQRLNDYVKEVCSLAGMDAQQAILRRYSGTNPVERTETRSRLVSMHTARRTLVTLSHEAGHLERDIMNVTGQRDYKTLAKYYKPTGTAAQREQLRLWWDERGSV